MAEHSTAAKANWSGGTSPWGISYGKMMMWFFLISDALTFGGLLTAYGFMRHKHADVWPKAEEVFTHFPFYDGHIKLAYVAFMTFVLIVSSYTMVRAVEAGHRLNKKGVLIWMFFTIIGGLIFVGSQAWEWYHFIVGTEGGSYILADGTHARMIIEHAHGALEHAKEYLILANGSIVEGQAMQALIDGAKSHIFGANMHVNEYGSTPLFANFFFFITGFHGFHVFSGVVINFIIFLNVLKGTYDKTGHYEMVEKSGLYWHFVDLVWVFVFTFFYLL